MPPVSTPFRTGGPQHGPGCAHSRKGRTVLAAPSCRSFRLWPNAAAGRAGRFLLQLQHSTQPAPQGKAKWRPWVACRLPASKIAGAKPLCAAGQSDLRATAKKISAACPPQAGILLRKSRACLRQVCCPLHAGIFRKAAPVSGRSACPLQRAFCLAKPRLLRQGLPARCMRAFCFAKPRLSPAGGLPARCKRAFCFAKPRLPPAEVCLPATCGHFASQNRACLRQGSACPLHAGILLRKAAPVSGRGLPARCKRAFCFAKPRLPPAGSACPLQSGHFASQNRACLRQGLLPAACGHFASQNRAASGRVCLPAACGHFASQNRRTPYFQKINAAVYVEPSVRRKAPFARPWAKAAPRCF